MEISIYIGVTIREIRHTHLVMHTFLQRGACQVLFIVTGINTIKCTAYIEPVRSYKSSDKLYPLVLTCP